jgi:biotin operon repressor
MNEFKVVIHPDPFETLGIMLQRVVEVRKIIEDRILRVMHVVADIRERILRGFRMAEAASPVRPSPIRTDAKPLTCDQKSVWDALSAGIMSAKEIALAIGLQTTDEDLIRKRIQRMRKAGWVVQQLTGRGYWRPDAVDPNGTSG